MVEERITDGRRIAQLLASEVEGRTDGGLGTLSVVDADRDVEATPGGARAYDVASGDATLARVFVHDDRARLEFLRGGEAARSDVEAAGDLAVDEHGEKTVLSVSSGAAVKRAARALSVAGESVEGGE